MVARGASSSEVGERTTHHFSKIVGLCVGLMTVGCGSGSGERDLGTGAQDSGTPDMGGAVDAGEFDLGSLSDLDVDAGPPPDQCELCEHSVGCRAGFACVNFVSSSVPSGMDVCLREYAFPGAMCPDLGFASYSFDDGVYCVPEFRPCCVDDDDDTYGIGWECQGPDPDDADDENPGESP